MGDVHNWNTRLISEWVPGRGHISLWGVVLQENRWQVRSRTSAELLSAELNFLEPLQEYDIGRAVA
jgi:hypothetical protein